MFNSVDHEIDTIIMGTIWPKYPCQNVCLWPDIRTYHQWCNIIYLICGYQLIFHIIYHSYPLYGVQTKILHNTPPRIQGSRIHNVLQNTRLGQTERSSRPYFNLTYCYVISLMYIYLLAFIIAFLYNFTRCHWTCWKCIYIYWVHVFLSQNIQKLITPSVPCIYL